MEIDSKAFRSYMRSTAKFFSTVLEGLEAQAAAERAEADQVAENAWAAMNTESVPGPKKVRVSALKCREAAVQDAVDTLSSKQRYTHGVSDLANGTKIHTNVRMKGRASGEKRVVKAVVKNGKIYLVGRPRGYNTLARALYAARGVAGKADREYSTTPPTSAWYISDNGCTISHYRRNIA